MSGKQHGLKRVFGVKKKRLPPEPKFTRPEGSTEPIERTQVAGAARTGRTMAPKRWEERRNER